MVAKALSGQSSLLATDLLAYYRQVSQSLLTVIDVETTGSLAYRSRVIEVSILQASLADGIHQQQTFLINPGVRIPRIITRVTGITQEMVLQGEAPEVVWPQCRTALSQGILTAHNLEFDYGFLQAEYQRLRQSYSRPANRRFCTVLLSRLLLADLPSRSLPNLVQHFGFDVGPSHRAGADTKACWLLAEGLLQQIQQESDQALLARFSQQWIRLKDAATLIGRPRQQVQRLMEEAGMEARMSRRGSRIFYRRGDVEQLYWAMRDQPPNFS
ncbi:DNA polymerase III subunit epsilon [Halomicronema hongdechloris C2206]|uniref:DNA polymerase III subunit epsilon n=1 Tax=Halomicronema hongdechloris C2206 TaxID=1641165 RepID=A0A1Z3HIR7_9CYAN|nr:3'-5' exonuclease [Halomicronema hongdechloris]ASC70212.1 DNA polymerase III subunit epsilon [Halomicronema hongdechloris C2206]